MRRVLLSALVATATLAAPPAAGAADIGLAGFLGGPQRPFALPDGAVFTSLEGQVFRSADAGTTWRAVRAGAERPDGFARTTDGTFWMSEGTSLSASTDGGASFRLGRPGIGLGHPMPGGGTMYGDGLALFAVGDELVHVSSCDVDAGRPDAWRFLEGGLPAADCAVDAVFTAATQLASGALLLGGRDRIWRLAPGATSWVEVATAGPIGALAGGTGGRAFALSAGRVLRSDDDGLTWDPTGSPSIEATRLAADPASRDRVVATDGSTTFESRDGGATWAELTIDGGPVTAVAAAPGGSGRLLVTTPSRLYRREAGSDAFEPAGPRIGDDGFTLGSAQDPFAPSRLLAVTTLGIYASDDGGATWTRSMTGAVDSRSAVIWPGDVIFDPRIHGRAWAYSQDWLHVSDDGGRTWLRRTPGDGDLAGTTTPVRIAIDPATNDGVLLPAGSAVVQVLPRGRTRTVGSPVCAARRCASVKRVSADPRDPRTLVAVARNGLWRTVDRGGHWTRVVAGQGHGGAALSRQAGRPDTLLAALGDGALRRSTDGGATWTELSLVGVADIATRADGVALATLRSGAVAASTNGATWTRAASSLGRRGTGAIAMVAAGGRRGGSRMAPARALVAGNGIRSVVLHGALPRLRVAGIHGRRPTVRIVGSAALLRVRCSEAAWGRCVGAISLADASGLLGRVIVDLRGGETVNVPVPLARSRSGAVLIVEGRTPWRAMSEIARTPVRLAR